MAPNTRTPVFTAIPLDSATDAIKEPLILVEDPSKQQEAALAENRLDAFKLSSLILGLFVGFFVQFSTLGANFLLINIWGEGVLSSSKNDVVMFSLFWSFLTSVVAIIILTFLRTLVTVSFNAAVFSRPTTTTSVPTDLLEQMILHMESRFVVGALVGVCSAWTATDVLLGMKAQLLYPLGTLMVSLVWCKLMMYCFGDDNKTKKRSTEGEVMIV